MDQTASIKDWLGRTQTEEDEIALGAVRRLAAMLDQEPGAFRRGGAMPESFYCLLFGPTARQSSIGPDGHPLTGDFLPPLPNTRRMFAGRRVQFKKPLMIGDIVTRTSTITQAEPKTGRSGSFTLVTVKHELSAGAGVAITEEQDLVYRAAVADATAAAAPAKAEGAKKEMQAKHEEQPQWSHAWTPDTVQLFRYSALTFNSHRIHYDLPYAREKEGYPALVINGGLTALMLVESAKPHLLGAIAGYDARAQKPLFIGQTVALNGRVSGNTAEVWASDPSGAENYRLNITLKGQ